MRIEDIWRRVMQGRDGPRPEPYEVWHARWPEGRFRDDGSPQGHYVIVIEAGANDRFRCLMINTDRGTFEVAAELSEDQCHRAGVGHGVLGRRALCHVPLKRFDERTGGLLREEVLKLEVAILKRRRSPRPSSSEPAKRQSQPMARDDDESSD